MTFVSDFYFSRVIGRKVYSQTGTIIGKLKDIIVNTDSGKPKVVAAIVASSKGISAMDFSYMKFEKVNEQYRLQCSNQKEYDKEGKKILYLAKNILDRQIIDMDGRKLVRVNDLKLAVLSNGTYLIAADIGIEGLLRRLGAAKLFKNVFKPFGLTLSSHLILWDDVETVDFGHTGIKLSKDYSNLERLHPSDLADIIEDMDRITQIAVLSSLNEEKAADVLEELEPEIQRSVLESLPLDKAADLLEKMPADEAADIIDELRKDMAEDLLNEMEEDASDDIRELLEYSEDMVGSIMTTDFISFSENRTVEQTIEELRSLKPETDSTYYMYILNETDYLIATITLWDLLVAEPKTKLKQIMNTNVLYVYDEDQIESLSDIITKYSLIALPVVNSEKQLQGVVLINDVLYNLQRLRRKRI